MIVKALLTIVMMLVSGAVFATSAAQRDDFRERDEFTRTYQLAQGARVEISSIRGSVRIINADTATAEVRIIRTARTRADLEYHKIEVEQSGNTLIVRGVQEPEQRRERNIQVDHEIILKLPQRIDLSVTSISGSVHAGNVDGEINVSSVSGSVSFGDAGGKLQVTSVSGSVVVGNVDADARVKSVSGNVNLGQVNGPLDVSSVSGGVNAKVVNLNPQGIHINSVSGSIEIRFKSDVNADFSAEGVSGQVYLDVPNVTRDSETKAPSVRARIGAGGTPISITSVSGSIRLTRS